MGYLFDHLSERIVNSDGRISENDSRLFMGEMTFICPIYPDQ